MRVEHIQHNRFISRLSIEAQKIDPLRRAICGAMLLAGGDPLVESREDIDHYVKLAGNSNQALKTLKSFFKVIINELDDRLDTMAPEELLALGQVRLGTHPCEFLKNLLTPKDWAAFDGFVETWSLRKEDAMIICNVFAEIHVKAAQAAQQLKTDPWNITLRDQLTHEHIRSGELCGPLFANAYKHKKLDPATDVTFERIVASHPKVARVARILEYYDDVRDFFEDYTAERRSGIANANSVLTEFIRISSEKNSGDCSNGIELNRFMDRAAASRKTVGFGDLPENLRFAMYEVVRKSEKEAAELRGPQPTAAQRVAYDFAIDMIGAQLKTGWTETVRTGAKPARVR